MTTGTDWSGCYSQGWYKGDICPAAFSHPAKFARRLIERIYEHAFEQGWLHEGDLVVDPFGGVALGGLDAAVRGVRWIGCELEPKFVALGNENIGLWQRKYGTLKKWTRPVLLQGDSRSLRAVLQAAGVSEASMIAGSPPFSPGQATGGPAPQPIGGGSRSSSGIRHNYGASPGQLGAMPEGALADGVVSSPPFMAAQTGGGLAKPEAVYAKDGHHFGKNHGYQNQGATEGQLAAMPPGAQAIISSPPYERAVHDGNGIDQTKLTGNTPGRNTQAKAEGYGAGNLGSGNTFWTAARAVVSECHAILKPGGHAIWVLGNFVRKGKIVDFAGQWQAMGEQVGFITCCRHRALKVERHGKQHLLDGGQEDIETRKVSFFRHLANKRNLAAAIVCEFVLCMRKP